MPAVSPSPRVTNSVVARQVELNRGSLGAWESFEPHRRRVTELIVGGGPTRGGRLCILGGGNCNDLDLGRLANAFSEVHLVDVDREAIEKAAKRQSLEDSSRVVLHGGIELGGIADRLSAARPASATERELDDLIQQAAQPPEAGLADPGADLSTPFDVVASTCLLTQLMNSAVDALGAGHPRVPELLAAIRTAHVRLLAKAVAPGGRGLLITDVASTDACKHIETVGDAELSRLERRIARRSEYFLEVDPALIEEQLRTDVDLGSRIDSVERTPPWRWRITSQRTYLVVGFVIRAAKR